MKRNFLSEIKAIKARAGTNRRYEIIARLDTIEKAIKGSLKEKISDSVFRSAIYRELSCKVDFQNSDSTHDNELLKLIPISTVSCFESFFGSIIKELIDFGKPFIDNAVKFNQSRNIKFDFDIVNAIQSKVVTMGEFVSHILPCNSFEDINSNISTLIGLDFADSLKKFKKRTISGDDENSTSFFYNYGQIVSDIKKIFELRHMFCHEFEINYKIDSVEIFRCFNNSKIFLNRTDDFIWDFLYPDAPLTQSDMNERAAEDFQNVENELSILISEIKQGEETNSLTAINKGLFDKSIEQWKIYRNLKAQSYAADFEGGSMYPTAYHIGLTKITREIIESLRKEFEFSLFSTNP